MIWLTRAVMLKLGVWAVWCQQHILNVYNSIKHAIANGTGKKDGGDESEADIGVESVNTEDDLRAIKDMLVSVVALVARMRIGCVL